MCARHTPVGANRVPWGSLFLACTPSRTTTAVVHTGEHRTSTFRSHSATDLCRHRLLIGQANAEPRMNARVRCPHDTACPCPGLTLCVHMCRCRRAAVRLHPPAGAHAHGGALDSKRATFAFGSSCTTFQWHSHPTHPAPVLPRFLRAGNPQSVQSARAGWHTVH